MWPPSVATTQMRPRGFQTHLHPPPIIRESMEVGMFRNRCAGNQKPTDAPGESPFVPSSKGVRMMRPFNSPWRAGPIPQLEPRDGGGGGVASASKRQVKSWGWEAENASMHGHAASGRPPLPWPAAAPMRPSFFYDASRNGNTQSSQQKVMSHNNSFFPRSRPPEAVYYKPAAPAPNSAQW
eukprot:GHVS01096204.1.p1 GENE.GHVS01096204.1~~GHVS01096204.1.p1  ORF type:complete len:200 (-),score=14.71 GHVS01096204.1:198-740(-)